MKELQLLKNGLFFIRQSIKHFKNTDKRKSGHEEELRCSIVFLFSGCILILKERLKQEHWSLLFSNVNTASERLLNSGDFHGVNFEDCQKRLKNIVSIKFTDKDDEILSLLKKKRNKIVHFFEEEESLLSFKSTLAKSLNFVINFIDKNLQIKTTNDKQNYEDIKEQCFDLKDFVQQRLISIKPQLEKHTVTLYCIQCGNDTIIPDEATGTMKCLFCYRNINESEYEDLYSYHYGEHPVKNPAPNTFCLECESENSLITTKDRKKYFCLYCHIEDKIELFDQCICCDVLYNTKDPYETSTFCPSCWDRITSKD